MEAIHRSNEVPQELQNSRTSRYNQERRETKEENRENELHADLAGPFLCFLPPTHSQKIRLCTQGLGDTGSETVGLDENRNQLTHLVFVGPLSEIS